MRLLFLLPLLLLTACASSPRQADRATYDLGGAAPVWKPSGLAIAGVSVQAPTWLSSPAIPYRLLYAGEMERHAYADSRWAAPPTELIERALNRQPSGGEGGCRLRLEIDDLIQVFETPQTSRTLLDVRASLFAPGGEAVLARRAFSAMETAPSADARGGVIAAAAAVRALGAQLNTWLAETARDKPAIARRCSPG